jgi:hypothetical protein
VGLRKPISDGVYERKRRGRFRYIELARVGRLFSERAGEPTQ